MQVVMDGLQTCTLICTFPLTTPLTATHTPSNYVSLTQRPPFSQTPLFLPSSRSAAPPSDRFWAAAQKGLAAHSSSLIFPSSLTTTSPLPTLVSKFLSYYFVFRLRAASGAHQITIAAY